MAGDKGGRPLDFLQQRANIPMQFLLADYLLVAPEVAALSQAVAQLEREESVEQDETCAIPLSAINQSLSALLGAPSPAYASRAVSWYLESGVLRKFYRHCHELILPSDTLESELARVRLAAGEALYDLVRAQMATQGPSCEEMTRAESIYRALTRRCRRALGHLGLIPQLLPELLKPFGRDENVLFFLLRHHHQLDEIYSFGFARKLLGELYAGTLEEVEAFLSEQYKSRGFQHLLQHIATCMAALNPCP